MFRSRPLYYTRSLPEGIIQKEEVSISTQLILHEAEKMGIKWEIISDTDVIELTYQSIVRSFRSRMPFATSYFGAKVCNDKQLAKMLLNRAGLKTVPGFAIYENDSDDRIVSMWTSLKKPLVLKPAQGSYGGGVEIGLMQVSQCLEKIHEYFKKPLFEGGLILEEMFVGSEYRILATKEKVVAVMERVPAHVIGDGDHTVEELIEIENKNPLRNISETLYPHISLDHTSHELLTQQHLTPTSIPSKGQLVRLKKVSNIKAGGIAIDRTDIIHPSVKELALQTVNAIPGLGWVGIDFMTTDIQQPQTEQGYIIIEMNCAAEFDMHDIPMQGIPRGAAKEFLYLMFPELIKI